MRHPCRVAGDRPSEHLTRIHDHNHSKPIAPTTATVRLCRRCAAVSDELPLTFEWNRPAAPVALDSAWHDMSFLLWSVPEFARSLRAAMAQAEIEHLLRQAIFGRSPDPSAHTQRYLPERATAALAPPLSRRVDDANDGRSIDIR